jgi:ketosteroid isomerase-like protein
VRAEFDAYERALLANDVDALDHYIWDSADTVRFGIAENLYGAEAIAAFRRTARTAPWSRSLKNTVIVTFGERAAAVSTEFCDENGETGRQSQTWMRFSGGWRIVAAHVSTMEER